MLNAPMDGRPAEKPRALVVSSTENWQGAQSQTRDVVITQKMVAAGVYEAREHPLGGSLDELVRNVFMAMALEDSGR